MISRWPKGTPAGKYDAQSLPACLPEGTVVSPPALHLSVLPCQGRREAGGWTPREPFPELRSDSVGRETAGGQERARAGEDTC